MPKIPHLHRVIAASAIALMSAPALLAADLAVPAQYATIQAAINASANGDTIVVSPQASLRRGDRCVVKTTTGEVMAKQLIRKGQRKLELTSLNAAHGERVLEISDVVFCHRILWVSQ
jgi:hypothetical protein